jgi:hypothetical protein
MQQNSANAGDHYSAEAERIRRKAEEAHIDFIRQKYLDLADRFEALAETTDLTNRRYAADLGRRGL